MTKVKGFIKMVLQVLRRTDYILFYLFFCCRYRMKSGKILMLSDSRESLSGNLFFIDQELRKRGYHPQHFLKKNLKAKKSLQEKMKLCKAMAEAEFILVDDFYPLIYPIPLRKQTRLIQVWHAMGAFKTVGFSRAGKPGGPLPFNITHRNYTDAIVSSEAIRKNYAEAFHMKVEDIHAVGVPRTDIFFDPTYESRVKEEIYSRYPVLKGKKVILFAPTFRGNGQLTAHYRFEWLDLERIRKELGEDYIFVIKLHPFITQRPENPDPDFFLDLSKEREINDLLFVTDILITDYSSVIFEASLLRRRTIFYVPDLKEYISSRDFYYPFEEYTYGPVAQNTDQLLSAIMEEDAAQNRAQEEKLDRFLEKFCSACDGKSSARFVDKLIEDKEGC